MYSITGVKTLNTSSGGWCWRGVEKLFWGWEG